MLSGILRFCGFCWRDAVTRYPAPLVGEASCRGPDRYPSPLFIMVFTIATNRTVSDCAQWRDVSNNSQPFVWLDNRIIIRIVEIKRSQSRSSSSILPIARTFGEFFPWRFSLATTPPQIPWPRGQPETPVSHLEIHSRSFIPLPPNDSTAILTFHYGRLDVADCFGCSS